METIKDSSAMIREKMHDEQEQYDDKFRICTLQHLNAPSCGVHSEN